MHIGAFAASSYFFQCTASVSIIIGAGIYLLIKKKIFFKYNKLYIINILKKIIFSGNKWKENEHISFTS